jgi:hypothetical protein
MDSETKLNQALWYTGTGSRMKRFLAKAKRGEGFTVGVVGGSGKSPHLYYLTSLLSQLTCGVCDLMIVSAGHGLNIHHLGQWKEPTTPLNMNRAIFDHLDSLFPAPGGQVIGEAGGNGKNGFVNGAQGATGESYFFFLLQIKTGEWA